MSDPPTVDRPADPDVRGRSQRRGGWWSGLGLAALVIVVWATRFAGRGTEPALDVVLYFFPSYLAAADRLAAGSFPLWNPFHLGGLPWLGTLQGGVCYPPHLLHLLLPIHQAFAVSQALHLVLIAVATAACVRRLGIGAAGAVLAAVVFTLRGRVPYALATPNYVEAAAWLPVGALAIVDLVRAPGPRGVALLAIATGASFLAGYPQPTVYIIYTWAALLLAVLLDARANRRSWMHAVTAFCGGLALGTMLAAVQLAPAIELARLGTRETGELADRAMFHTAAVLTPALRTFRYESIAGTPFAFGMVVLALAPAALLSRRRALAGWALGLAVLSGLFALGKFTPVFSLYLALPGLAWFRNPNRITLVTDFAVAIAAALGLHTVTTPRHHDGGSAPLASAPAIVVAAVALAAFATLGLRGWASAAAAARVAGFGLVTAMLLAAALARPRWSLLAAAFVVTAIGEVVLNPWHAFRLPYSAADSAVYRTQEPLFRELAATAGHDRAWRFAPGFQPAFAAKLATLYRLRAIGDYEPLNLRRQADYFTYLTEASTDRARPPWLFGGDVPTLRSPPGVPASGTRRRLLDLMATRLFVGPVGMLMGSSDIRDFVTDAGLVRREWPGVVMFENPQALPRAFVTYHVRSAPADAEETLAAISRVDFDPLMSSYVEGPSPLGPGSGEPRRGRPARFLRDEDEVVELEATLDEPGLVVLADTAYPGWVATVDGAPRPIVVANYLFRGVVAPAGVHRVRFEYRSGTVRLGAGLSAVAVVLLALVIVRARRSRDARAAPARSP